MPFKHNAAHRHRIPKARYRIQNWPAYEAGRKCRGDLTLWLVFHLALRQAEGFAASLLRLLAQALCVPDHTTLSRRSRSFAGHQPKVVPNFPLHLVIDSTGPKLFGQGEWDEEKQPNAPVLA